MAQLFQVGECGIDHAGAGNVEASGALLQLFNDLVSVARFFIQQLQYQELQIRRGELAPRAKSSAPHTAREESASEMAETRVAMAPNTVIKAVPHGRSRQL